MIRIYHAIAWLAAIFALPVLAVLAVFSAKYRAGLSQRLGLLPPIARRRRDARRVWLHCASVGEVQTAAPLIERLLADARVDLVLSTMTPTGNRVARQRFGGRCPVIFWPIELSASVASTFRAVRPDALLILETELWPAVLDRARRNGVPVAVLNARISDRTRARYGRLRFFFRPLLESVAVFAVQTEDHAARLRALGVPGASIRVTGNLKFDLGLSREAALAAPSFLDGRKPTGVPVVCFASTHEGEEDAALAAYAAAREALPGLCSVIAPRHPECAAGIAEVAAKKGVSVVRRSALAEGETFDADVALLDTVGELVPAMARSLACFVGGSLVPVGGHNVLEPAAVGVPVLFGPHMENFRDAEAALVEAGGAIRVADGAGLATALVDLVADAELRSGLAARAAAAVEQNRGATARTFAAIETLLTAPSSRDR